MWCFSNTILHIQSFYVKYHTHVLWQRIRVYPDLYVQSILSYSRLFDFHVICILLVQCGDAWKCETSMKTLSFLFTGGHNLYTFTIL